MELNGFWFLFRRVMPAGLFSASGDGLTVVDDESENSYNNINKLELRLNLTKKYQTL